MSYFYFASINWPFLVVLYMSGQFLFELRFWFSVGISVHCGNALVVLERCLSAFLTLEHFSFEHS